MTNYKGAGIIFNVIISSRGQHIACHTKLFGKSLTICIGFKRLTNVLSVNFDKIIRLQFICVELPLFLSLLVRLLCVKYYSESSFQLVIVLRRTTGRVQDNAPSLFSQCFVSEAAWPSSQNHHTVRFISGFIRGDIIVVIFRENPFRHNQC